MSLCAWISDEKSSSQRRRLYVVVGPDSQSAKWRHHNRSETSETTPHSSHLKPISSSNLTFSLQLHRTSHSFSRLKPFQWTSDYVLNVYCPFAAAPSPFANTCHASHFSQISENVRAELKRQ